MKNHTTQMKNYTPLIAYSLIILSALLVAACTVEQPRQSSNAMMQFESYGGFVNPARAKDMLTIEPGKASYTVFDSQGAVVQYKEKPLDNATYDQALRLFLSKDFNNLKDRYDNPQPVPDVGSYRLTLVRDGVNKTVEINDYTEEKMPSGLSELTAFMRSLMQNVSETSQQDARNAAESWIKNAPTYKYDGSSLALVNVSKLEGVDYYTFTYSFTSSHAGYGNRSGQVVAQAVTNHQIVIEVVNGVVSSAVIDGAWDEYSQHSIVTGNVVVSYKPMQCVDEPWNAWLANSSIRFIKAPTESEIITMYYGQAHGVEVSGYRRINLGQATCMACGVCPKGYVIELTVPASAVDVMKADGWTVAGNTTDDADGANAAGGSQIANPASAYCVEQGYNVTIRTAGDGSQQGYCTSPSKQCEEWAFYRGECNMTQ